MKPRLDIQFPLRRQLQYWCGERYEPQKGEYLLNHARTGMVMALRAALPKGGRVGVVVYNCHTVANAVVNAGCVPVFMDVTEKLTIDVESVPANLDAIVVTNLFGIRNNIAAIKKRCPSAVVIVDNAHGYGLPTEGEFTVYSINQGKFPSLGEGGLLYANEEWRLKIKDLYKALPKYGFIEQMRLFGQMLIKAIAYSRCLYRLTMKMKKSLNPKAHQKVVMKKMAPGIRRLYKVILPEIPKMIELQRQNAAMIDGAFYGENAFMAIVKCENPEALKAAYAAKGIETETHFKHCVEWAEQFGYKRGSCPKAEYLIRHLLMIPTYTKI